MTSGPTGIFAVAHVAVKISGRKATQLPLIVAGCNWLIYSHDIGFDCFFLCGLRGDYNLWPEIHSIAFRFMKTGCV